jgi:hypothetical protein
MRALLASILVAASLAGCAARDPSDPITTRVSALTPTLSPAADTFINSSSPDNNNGTSPSIYTGKNGQNGLMRGLVRFTMPPELQGRVTVSGVTLAMVTRGTGASDTTPPTPATESLQAITVAWSQGSGFGDGTTTNTVGQPCGTTGATWNQPNCAGGTPWAGGTAASTVSGTASVPATLMAVVTWDSTAGNAGMIADVQSWIDTPAPNLGWLITSSTEAATGGMAQRFFSLEGGKGPRLMVTAACKTGFIETIGGCSPCTSAASAACVTARVGNACNDPGAPAATYVCTCNNPAYVAGAGGASCVDRNECATNHCVDSGDQTATCADAPAPVTGYTCLCSSGFSFNGTTCVSACGGANDPCGLGGTCTAVAAGGWTCACTSGFTSTGGTQPTCADVNGCTTMAGNGACVSTMPGNSCVDEAPPSVGYHCICGNAAYAVGAGADGKPACLLDAGTDGGAGDGGDAGDAAGSGGAGGAAGSGGAGGAAGTAGGAGGNAGAGGRGGAGATGGAAAGAGGGGGAAGGGGGAGASGGGGAAGNADAGGASAGAGGGGGHGGAAGTAGTGNASGGGCSCSFGEGGERRGGAAAPFGVAAVAWLTRRRRRAART